MTIADMSDPATLTGAPVQGSGGEKLGKVHSVYYDNDTNKPEWVAVKSGLFGGHVSLVPLNQGNWDGNALTVPFGTEQLKNAPHHDPDVEISVRDEEELYRHYGVDYSQSEGQPRGGESERIGRGGPGRDTSGPNTDEAMTRSEEQLRVGAESRESGRARLRKHIVTENVSTTVPVRHEEVTLEREPITEANRGQAMSGGELTEEVHEVTLHEERAVVQKDVVPVERVRLGTETVTEQEQVNETVRKEEIETEGVETGRGDPGKNNS